MSEAAHQPWRSPMMGRQSTQSSGGSNSIARYSPLTGKSRLNVCAATRNQLGTATPHAARGHAWHGEHAGNERAPRSVRRLRFDLATQRLLRGSQLLGNLHRSGPAFLTPAISFPRLPTRDTLAYEPLHVSAAGFRGVGPFSLASTLLGLAASQLLHASNSMEASPCKTPEE